MMQSLRLEQTPLKEEQQGVVNFCARLGRSPSETQALLQEAYKQDALRKAATRTYYKRFQALGVAVYDDKRKSRTPKGRHSTTSEHPGNDSQNDESNSDGPNSGHFTRKWDPLISQASGLNDYSEKENGESPSLQIHVKHNEDSSDIDDDLTDILEDDFQDDQESMLKCETFSEDTNVSSYFTNDTDNEDINVSSSITNETYHDTPSHSGEELHNINCTNSSNMEHNMQLNLNGKDSIHFENNLYNSEKNCKENSRDDQFNQSTVINSRNNTIENATDINQSNISKEDNSFVSNTSLRNGKQKEQKKSMSGINKSDHNDNHKYLLENEMSPSTHNIEAPPSITRKNAISLITYNVDDPSNITRKNTMSLSTHNEEAPGSITREHANVHTLTIGRADTMNWFANLNSERWKVIRKTDAMNWFVNLNGEQWKVKSYHSYI